MIATEVNDDEVAEEVVVWEAGNYVNFRKYIIYTAFDLTGPAA